MGQMQIHILGIRPVFWPRNEIGSSEWCAPSSTSSSRPNSKDSRSEQIPITVEEIVSMVRQECILVKPRTSLSIYGVPEIGESSW